MVYTGAKGLLVVFSQGKPHLAIIIRPRYCETALKGKLCQVQAELNGPGPQKGHDGLVVTGGRQPASYPDFLWDFVALTHFMRLSVKKGAHAARSNAAWQEFRGGRT